jgi:glutamine synthetase
MSVFIGSELSAVLDELEHNGNIKVEKGDNMYMKLGIDKIPSIILDNTDRNRTSPFAFTGNKFEFRAVGSDTNVAAPMSVLNLIVADVLTDFAEKVDALIEKGEDKRLAIVNVLRSYIKDSKKVRFEGDGYSDDWVKEAKKRGLANITDTPRSLAAYLSKKTVELYKKFNVLAKPELEARNEINYENFILKVQIEARSMGDLSMNHIIPTAIKYQNKLIDNAKGLSDIGLDNNHIKPSIDEISRLIKNLITDSGAMLEERKRVNKLVDTATRAIAYHDDIKEKYFDKIRKSVDLLELIVDDEDWPLPKYRELLFIR